MNLWTQKLNPKSEILINLINEINLLSTMIS